MAVAETRGLHTLGGAVLTTAGGEDVGGSIRYPRGGLLVDDVTVLAQAVPGVEDPQLSELLRRSGHGG